LISGREADNHVEPTALFLDQSMPSGDGAPRWGVISSGRAVFTPTRSALTLMSNGAAWHRPPEV